MAVVEEVQTLLLAYAEALRDGDLEAVLRCFSENAVVMAPAAPTAAGDEIRGLYTQILQSLRLDIEFSVDLVVAADQPVAFTHSDGMQTGTDGGATAKEANREAFAFVRRDGELKISRYLFNTLA